MNQIRRQIDTIFFRLFLFLGLILTFAFGYWMIWLPLCAQLFYQETDCVVLDKRLDENRDAAGTTSRALFHIEYMAEGRQRKVWTYDASGIYSNFNEANLAVLQQFQKGKHYPCWYDPGNPDHAVLTRSFSWWSLIVLLPLIFVFIGAGGLIFNRSKRDATPVESAIQPFSFDEARPALGFAALLVGGFLATGALAFFLMFNFGGFLGGPVWVPFVLFLGPFVCYGVLVSWFMKDFMEKMKRIGPSPERLAARTQKKSDSGGMESSLSATVEEEEVWPTVPASPQLSPGDTLSHRLTTTSQPLLFLLGTFLIAAFWNGIVSIFVYHVIDNFRLGNPDWFLTIFMIPFVVIGLALILTVFGIAIYSLGSLAAGSFRVEIASHPLNPGTSVDVVMMQSGLVALKRASLTLRCMESATYTAGTSSRSETREVYIATVLGPEPKLMGELRGTLVIPETAMHSFEAPHNSISWHLEVGGLSLGILPFEKTFPIIIRPTGKEMRS